MRQQREASRSRHAAYHIDAGTYDYLSLASDGIERGLKASGVMFFAEALAGCERNDGFMRRPQLGQVQPRVLGDLGINVRIGR